MSDDAIAHFPLFLDLHDVPVLLVGGGPVGQRKLELLLRCGARLTVLEPDPALAGPLRALLGGKGELHSRDFREDDVRGQRLVIAATASAAVNAAVAAAARTAGIWVNVVDAPQLGDAIVPAIVSRGPLTVGISTSGAAPVLARRLRARLETLLEPSLAQLAELLRQWRPRIRNALPDPAARRDFYDRMLDGPLQDLLRCGQQQAAQALLQRELDASPDTTVGKVILLGAGPGDPGLLTLNGLRHLQRADVIVHDRLVSAQVLDLARRDALRIEVGKTGGGHSCSQLQINQILLAHAGAGRYVVRLKGGDPLTFARGGEELEVLRAHRIPFEIVPGITAAQGCAAYAGIALTHRAHAQSLRLVTAHCQGASDKLDWNSLSRSAAAGETLVFYMGLQQAAEIQLRLLQGGLPSHTPFTAIENGTRPQQRVVDGRLDQLVQTLRDAGIGSPALLMVGAVTAPALRHAWFGHGTGQSQAATRAMTPATASAMLD